MVNKFLRKVTGIVLVAFSAFFVTGCAAFSSYSKEVRPGLNKMDDGNFESASEWFEKRKSDEDRSLGLIESGRAAQLAGNRKLSKKNFEEAIERFEYREMEADVTSKKIGEQATAILVNDNTIDYRVRGYEKVMVYHHQAMNYLFDGDLEGAAVEIRRAVMAQQMELRRYEDEVEESEVESQEEEDPNESATEAVKNRYKEMEKLAEGVKSQFQNPYTFYLSAIVEEMDKDYDNALIDYKKALEVVPSNSFIKKDVERLTKNGSDKTGRDVIILVEQGFIVQKKEIAIPVPTSKGILKIAFPLYSSGGELATNFEVFGKNDEVLGYTEALANLNGLAIKSLKDEAIIMAVRNVARVIGKAALQNQLDQNSEWGPLISTIWNIFSENADLRAWYTLPSTALLFRGNIDRETEKLVLKRGSKQLSLTLPREGEVVIIKVIDVGEKLRADIITY